MPKDNIDRAIAKGSGADADASAFETVVYEGYGPSGVAVIVEALTDNRNRTASDVRHTFAKNDGNLGGSGAVSWLFERRGVVLVPAAGTDEDELTLAAAEGGADDVALDGSSYQVLTAPESLAVVREAIERAGFAIDSAELTMLPKTTVEVANESGREESPAPDGRAGGQRRRPGRVRELRHSRAGARSGRRLGGAGFVTFP